MAVCRGAGEVRRMVSLRCRRSPAMQQPSRSNSGSRTQRHRAVARIVVPPRHCARLGAIEHRSLSGAARNARRRSLQQTAAEAFAKSVGCIRCHQGVGDMHDKETVRLGCCDCHGGNPCADDQGSGPRLSAISRRLAQQCQSGAKLHAAESRIAGIHSLRQSRRFARGPHQLRRVPCQRSPAKSAKA